MNDLMIGSFRNCLKLFLKSYDGDKKIKLKCSNKLLHKILFDKFDDFYVFAIDFDKVKKLDLSDVSFDNVCVQYLDFTGCEGVIINPQTIYNKSLYRTNCSDAIFTDTLDGVDIRGAIIPMEILNIKVKERGLKL